MGTILQVCACVCEHYIHKRACVRLLGREDTKINEYMWREWNECVQESEKNTERKRLCVSKHMTLG